MIDTELDICGCCESGVPAGEIANRPGLPSLAYRIGRHPEFLARMVARLGRRVPALTTRDADDPALAVLDAWATIADVLSFYQERLANESYLRTATERRSILELARTIGYELSPGVAASTYLAFTVDDRPPPPGMPLAPGRAAVARGTKVQSLPAGSELPQVFESGHDMFARADWNVLRPRLRRPQPLELDTRRLYVDGLVTQLAAGDRILITTPATAGAGVETSVAEVVAAVGEPALERTRVDLTPVGKPAQTVTPPAPFAPAALPPAPFFLFPTELTSTFIRTHILGRRWSERRLRAQRRVQRWDTEMLLDNIEYEHRASHGLRKPRRHFGFADFDDLFEPIVLPPPAPHVVSFSPAGGSDRVNAVTNINVSFSHDMNPATITPATVQLRVAATAALVPAAVTYNAATRTATLDPNARLLDDTLYSAQVVAGAQGVRSQAGRALSSGITWSFTTAPDLVPPTILAGSRSPAPGATNVPVTAAVSVAFNEPMQAASVTATTFTLSLADKLVPATVSYDAAATTARLVPTKALEHKRTYTVTVEGQPGVTVRDVGGNAMTGAATWSFETEQRPPQPPPAERAVYAFRERAGFFGHNAPVHGSLPSLGMKRDPYPKSWDAEATGAGEGPRTVWTDSQGNVNDDDQVFVERTIPDLPKETWAILESAKGITPYWIVDVAEASRADYALSARTSRLALAQRNGDAPLANGTPEFMVRETTAHLRSESLLLAELPIDDPLQPGDFELVLDRMVLDLDEGQPLALRGERRDLPGVIGDEILVLDDAFHEDGFTTLRFRESLRYGYVRRTVTLSANVVGATHGETVAGEILGSGDGLRANQRFALNKPPLTYVSAPTPSGAESTLEVRIDGVKWEQVERLADAGPRDRRYIVRREDDGSTSIVFGDGEHGARPPTGAENVVATYRTGMGVAGNLPAERLTLMLTRPPGIAAVANRVPASGAAEPETRDAARANAPLTVMTMDRIVSVRDFEDFARGFAGIGKAQATTLGRGETQLVHVTVAGEDGVEVVPTSDTYRNLVAAMERVRDPGATVQVDSYARRYFDVEATIVIDPLYLSGAVIAAVQERLLAAFSFEQRTFAQAVTAAEVIATIQAVAGVVAVDLDVLRPSEGAEQPLAPVLRARRARYEAEAIRAAELLLVNPGIVPITERPA